jgi:putative serine protease PepD
MGSATRCEQHPGSFGTIDPMSDERDPAGPWAQPGQQPDPTAPAAGAVQGPDQTPTDATGPVDLEHTRELTGSETAPPPAWADDAPASDAPASDAPASDAWANDAWANDAWANDAPTGWPATAPGDPAATGWPSQQPPQQAPVPDAPALPVAPQPTAQPAPSGGGRRQNGPGWGALVAVAAVASLLAAILGGLFGGWLGATNRVDFGRLDRAGSSIPRVGAGATARPSGSIASIAANALPSVVTIKVKGADGAGTGSGFVIDHQGHILTNNHVVAGAAGGGSITIELSDGSEVEATIAGRDGSYDLAVLKIGRTDLPPLTMGVSKDVVVGDPVIAVGAPLGLESTVTSGIVSALNRPVSPGGDGDQQSFINAIQTDAAINPGNSGGPLLDLQGHVIGVNSAIARVPGTTDTQSGNIGVGFSIPSDQAVKTAEQLIKTGKAQHPVIGVVLDRQYTGAGVRILAQKTSSSGEPVDPNGPAGKAGVKPGDVIVEFDGRRVNQPDDLVVAIRAKNVGDQVSMKVKRGSQTISVRLTLSGTSGS